LNFVLVVHLEGGMGKSVGEAELLTSLVGVYLPWPANSTNFIEELFVVWLTAQNSHAIKSIGEEDFRCKTGNFWSSPTARSASRSQYFRFFINESHWLPVWAQQFAKVGRDKKISSENGCHLLALLFNPMADVSAKQLCKESFRDR
jgi:hypothetical protein